MSFHSDLSKNREIRASTTGKKEIMCGLCSKMYIHLTAYLQLNTHSTHLSSIQRKEMYLI